MIQEINLQGKRIGKGHPVYLVAEIGSNHCRDQKVVKKLIDIAADTGFDAVKFQTYEPLEVFSGKIYTTDLKMDHLYGHRPWWEISRDHILMPRDWFGEMFDYARKKGLQVFSTVHSLKDAEFILPFNPPVFKVASIDVSHTAFLSQLASLNKPLFLSTGMHVLGEIEQAVEVISKSGNEQIALLHCVSNYPPQPEDVNLNNIPMLHTAFDLPVGFSDHHPENYMAIAAVSLGACIIEKHVTLDRKMKGPDHAFALEPDGMNALVKDIRATEKALGSFSRILSEAELESRTVTRRSFIARKNIKKGEALSRQNVKLARPGTGIHPKYADQLLGRIAKVDIEKEDVVLWHMVE